MGASKYRILGMSACDVVCFGLMPLMVEPIFTLTKPSRKSIDAFLLHAKTQSFSYPETGLTRGENPGEYTVDHSRITLGSGNETFRCAISAIRAWEMFNIGWVRLLPQNAPITAGANVAVVIHHFGFWSKNASRIVYVIEEERRFGFAYGTLQQHAERGEERFTVEWNEKDDSVVYDILAFSRPGLWQTRIANPIARMLQKRFARDSMAAMKQAVA
jgi:uncharacterized protein (UPF0548 family)